MTMPVYEFRDDLFHPTEMARGPWDPRAQHGGAPGGLLLQRMSTLPEAGGRLTRATVEFLRPVPMVPLRLDVHLIRNGRQVQRSEATLYADEVAVARAEGLHVAPEADATADVAAELTRQPDEPRLTAPMALSRTGAKPGQAAKELDPSKPRKYPISFGADAVEIRSVYGHFKQPGPAAAWIRLLVPMVDGEPNSAWARLAAACDFGNGVSSVVSWKTHTFANADLTISVSRPPEGEWIGITAVTRASPDGIGIAASRVADVRGSLGVSHQTVLIRPRKA